MLIIIVIGIDWFVPLIGVSLITCDACKCRAFDLTPDYKDRSIHCIRIVPGGRGPLSYSYI